MKCSWEDWLLLGLNYQLLNPLYILQAITFCEKCKMTPHVSPFPLLFTSAKGTLVRCDTAIPYTLYLLTKSQVEFTVQPTKMINNNVLVDTNGYRLRTSSARRYLIQNIGAILKVLDRFDNKCEFHPIMLVQTNTRPVFRSNFVINNVFFFFFSNYRQIFKNWTNFHKRLRSFYPSDWHNNLVHTLVPAQFCLQCKLVSIAPSGHRHFATKAKEQQVHNDTCCLRLSGSTLRFRAGQSYVYIYIHISKCTMRTSMRTENRKLFIEYSNRCPSVFSERRLCHNCNEHLQ